MDSGQGRHRAAGVGREVERPRRAVCSGHSQLLLLLLLTLLLLTLLLLLLVVVVVVLLLLLLLLRRVAIGALKGSRHCTLQRQIDSHGLRRI